jgi:hypothetical protein
VPFDRTAPFRTEPTNSTGQNSAKRFPPRTNTSPQSPRRTISSYTLAPVLTTIVSDAAHEGMWIDAGVGPAGRAGVFTPCVGLSRRPPEIALRSFLMAVPTLARDITSASFGGVPSWGNIHATRASGKKSVFRRGMSNGAILACT